MKPTTDRIKPNSRGMLVPIALVIIFILAVLGIALYNYVRFERNLVARLQYSSIAEKMAQAAAYEASNWYNCKALYLKGLDKNNPIDRFVLAPVMDGSVNSLTISLTANELKSFAIIAGLKGSLDSVELKYEGFSSYFSPPAEPSDYSSGCIIASDPFERFGGLVITSKVTYKTITRVFCCRYEAKIANTLVPLLSKFTFYTRGRDAASENQLKMVPLADSGNQDYGGQGIVSKTETPLRAPLVMVHHPDDIAEIAAAGYYKNHSEIREYLPLDETVQPAAATGSGVSYRPRMTDRGWVYLGVESTPNSYYLLNVTPGKVNPDAFNPYPQNLAYRFYGNGFLLLESDLCALVFNALKGVYPYNFSFADAQKPAGVHDYIIRLTQTGIYWIMKHPAALPIIGNFYAANTDMVEHSSLLQLSGDMQAKAFASPARPSRYLDRRSPTVVFGRVVRSFASVGNICQNCMHPAGSPNAGSVLANGMHKMPFEICPGPHPRVFFLPFFNIDDNGVPGTNSVLPVDDADWDGHRMIDDTVDAAGAPYPAAAALDFAKASADAKNDIFKLNSADHFKNYKFFMSKIMFEAYNKSYNWITANSKPADGIIEPGPKYNLRQTRIKILESYPNSQPDELFFYNQGSVFGNCINACNIKISQYRKTSGGFDRANDLFADGIFRGSLAAVSLSSASYVNPMAANVPAAQQAEYDIRHKASHIFNTFGEFSAALLKADAAAVELKDSGVFYIDEGGESDLTQNNQVQKLVFHDNAMLIFKKGVKVPSIIKSAYARQNGCTLSIVSVDGDVTICGGEIEASLNSLGGTIKKAVDYFQVFGNMTMKKVYFNLSSPGNLFKVSSIPSGSASTLLGARNGEKGFARISVTYDPALDPCDAKNYLYHYKFYISSRQTYWRFYSE